MAKWMEAVMFLVWLMVIASALLWLRDPAHADTPAPARAQLLEPNVRVYRVAPEPGARYCLVVVAERTNGMAAGKSVQVACP